MNPNKTLISALALIIVGAVGMGITMYYAADQNGGDIPRSLPPPDDAAWTRALLETLRLEKLSLAQYSADASTYDSPMPYAMVIPQERSHVAVIERLLRAYGVDPAVTAPPVVKTKSLDEAYTIALGLETDLIRRYNGLIDGAPDRVSERALGVLLAQSRMHAMMFSRMGGGFMHGT